MHPVWFWDDVAPVALVAARPTRVTLAHLSAQPKVSCLCWDPTHDMVASDADAEWIAAADRADAWAKIASIAAPVGFDPATIWPDSPDRVDGRFLRLTAHRVIAASAGGSRRAWRASPDVGDRADRRSRRTLIHREAGSRDG